ncbi:threonine/serine exporter family protein [Lederbergia sp. NSJ-179]|uniref:threonine/serine exporter family protein n=1 Tax=Lederbergia sp. NSJ-179 TaxID=2931402 RepID=UPI001FD00F6A|nr:threonine/serine exporter family protein [Lederbergia sp. NSJ-179]MCJ7841101.1 threonine/serine exporter family protein [Lederbergia sp. NSJ-179]
MDVKVLKPAEEKRLVDACLLAGKILMQSGAETYRVEDTMMRMAAACGFSESQSFVTPTGIIFSLEGSDSSQFVRISQRGTDLEKIARVNHISRKMAEKELGYQEAFQSLKKLERENLSFPIWVQIFAATISTGSFLIMFKGVWADYIPAMLVGGLGFSAMLLIHNQTKVKFFAEFTAAFVIALLSLLFVRFGIGQQLDLIVIASVMPLVPGLLITNAIRDLMAGHFVAGLSKGAEALLTAFAIGAGVAVVYSLWL